MSRPVRELLAVPTLDLTLQEKVGVRRAALNEIDRLDQELAALADVSIELHNSRHYWRIAALALGTAMVALTLLEALL